MNENNENNQKQYSFSSYNSNSNSFYPPLPSHLTPLPPLPPSIPPSFSTPSNSNLHIKTPQTQTPSKKKARIIEFVETKEWNNNPQWYDHLVEILFRIKERNSTLSIEIYSGVVQFISCMYFLPVIPQKMTAAGYDSDITFTVTALTSALGCILAGLFANLPFIVAPPAAISIFVAVFLQSAESSTKEGDLAVILSGLSLVLLGWPPIGVFFTKLIPSTIQVGTIVGIGLLTALAGATEVNMIISGPYTVVGLGKITTEVMIALMGVIIIAIALHYHIKGAFCIALLIGTILWWTIQNCWPDHLLEFPKLSYPDFNLNNLDLEVALSLYADLLFLYILTLSGLVLSLSALANLIRDDGTTPRNRWIFIICGLMTMLSGLMGGPPILLSPESAAGIKAGAKTGLSSIVCGLLFGFSVFFAPILKAIPNAATSPVLIIVGVILFQNVIRVDWKLIKDSVPAFCILFFIPFTFSVLEGVAMGYFVYIIISFATGDLVKDINNFLHEYSSSNPTSPCSISTPTSYSLINESHEEYIQIIQQQQQQQQLQQPYYYNHNIDDNDNDNNLINSPNKLNENNNISPSNPIPYQSLKNINQNYDNNNIDNNNNNNTYDNSKDDYDYDDNNDDEIESDDNNSNDDNFTNKSKKVPISSIYPQSQYQHQINLRSQHQQNYQNIIKKPNINYDSMSYHTPPSSHLSTPIQSPYDHYLDGDIEYQNYFRRHPNSYVNEYNSLLTQKINDEFQSPISRRDLIQKTYSPIPSNNRQSMDGLDCGVKVNSGVLDMSNDLEHVFGSSQSRYKYNSNNVNNLYYQNNQNNRGRINQSNNNSNNNSPINNRRNNNRNNNNNNSNRNNDRNIAHSLPNRRLSLR